jgi:hypothetical protein
MAVTVVVVVAAAAAASTSRLAVTRLQLRKAEL